MKTKAEEILEVLDEFGAGYYATGSGGDDNVSTDAGDWMKAATEYSSDRRLQELYLQRYLGKFEDSKPAVADAIQKALDSIISTARGVSGLRA